MATQSLVFAKDPASVAAGVESAGGRLLHALTANLLVIELPDRVSAESIPGSSLADPGGLAGTERALAEAWLSRFGRVSRADERLAARTAGPPLSWDTPGYTPPDRLPGRQGPPPFSDDPTARSTNTPTSVTLTGSVAVGIVMVSGQGAALAFSATEKSQIMSEVIEGLNFLATADPTQNVSFVHDWQDITVAAAPGAGDDYEDFEAPWRNAALQVMGFAASRSGSVAYVNSLRSSRQTNWAYVAYFTKYPLFHFGYASGERLVMDYRNDGWGSAAINQVFAHETCHIFGAADEYGDCGCGASGHDSVPNNNCRNCTSAQIPCLMNANTLSLCAWSRGQIGWSPWQPIAGALKHVSVGQDGTVWGVNANDEIFRRAGSAWQRIAGALKQISVGNAGNVWGVNRNDEIFRRNGNAWSQVSGALKHVSVAADGTVWGVNADNKIFRRAGNAWTQISGSLKQVSAGSAAHVWGVNAQNDIFFWNGSAWTKVAGALKHVSVASDGTVWGVNANDQIYRRAGSVWEQVPGALKQISTGAAALVWGVNKDDRIYRRK